METAGGTFSCNRRFLHLAADLVSDEYHDEPIPEITGATPVLPRRSARIANSKVSFANTIQVYFWNGKRKAEHRNLSLIKLRFSPLCRPLGHLIKSARVNFFAFSLTAFLLILLFWMMMSQTGARNFKSLISLLPLVLFAFFLLPSLVLGGVVVFLYYIILYSLYLRRTYCSFVYTLRTCVCSVGGKIYLASVKYNKLIESDLFFPPIRHCAVLIRNCALCPDSVPSSWTRSQGRLPPHFRCGVGIFISSIARSGWLDR